MGLYTPLISQDMLARLSKEQRAILLVLNPDELRPLEEVIVRTLFGPLITATASLVDGWHAPYTPLPGPSL